MEGEVLIDDSEGTCEGARGAADAEEALAVYDSLFVAIHSVDGACGDAGGIVALPADNGSGHFGHFAVCDGGDSLVAVEAGGGAGFALYAVVNVADDFLFYLFEFTHLFSFRLGGELDDCRAGEERTGIGIYSLSYESRS